MAHWRAVLPKSTPEPDYEALVDGQERESRRLIEFCGLPWDARCRAFHETERAARTASLWRVRQPVYRRSVGPAGADTRRTSSHSRTREARMFQAMTVSDNFYAEPE